MSDTLQEDTIMPVSDAGGAPDDNDFSNSDREVAKGILRIETMNRLLCMVPDVLRGWRLPLEAADPHALTTLEVVKKVYDGLEHADGLPSTIRELDVPEYSAKMRYLVGKILGKMLASHGENFILEKRAV